MDRSSSLQPDAEGYRDTRVVQDIAPAAETYDERMYSQRKFKEKRDGYDDRYLTALKSNDAVTALEHLSEELGHELRSLSSSQPPPNLLQPRKPSDPTRTNHAPLPPDTQEASGA